MNSKPSAPAAVGVVNTTITQPDLKQSIYSARSRSRSGTPHGVRNSSNSPLRLLQKQAQNSSILVNACSFSNVKSQAAPKDILPRPISPTMREHGPQAALNYARDCVCLDQHHLNLTLTNKYAAKFGMEDEPSVEEVMDYRSATYHAARTSNNMEQHSRQQQFQFTLPT